MGRSIVAAPWIPGDGLDMTGMLQAFQQFWRKSSELWQARYDNERRGQPGQRCQRPSGAKYEPDVRLS